MLWGLGAELAWCVSGPVPIVEPQGPQLEPQQQPLRGRVPGTRQLGPSIANQQGHLRKVLPPLASALSLSAAATAEHGSSQA